MITFRTYKNPNEEEYKEIVAAVEANDGYCPCSIQKLESDKCMCEAFRNSQEADFCHCGRFYKVPQLETLALVGDITEDADYFDQWEMLLSKQDFIILPVKFDGHNLYHHSEGYTNLCRAKLSKVDAVFVLDDGSDWVLDMEVWSEAIGKRVLHRSDLAK